MKTLYLKLNMESVNPRADLPMVLFAMARAAELGRLDSWNNIEDFPRVLAWPANATLRGGCYVEGISRNAEKDLIKAGWLRKESGVLIITSQGRDNLGVPNVPRGCTGEVHIEESI